MSYREIMGVFLRLNLVRKLRMRKIIGKLGLHIGQPPMLEYVHAHPGCTQRETADELNITPASVASSFKRLERSGYITRKPDEKDTRRNRVFLTKQGEEAMQKNCEAIDALDEKMFEGFSDAEIAQLSVLLSRAFENLAGEEYKNLTVFSLVRQVIASAKGED